MAAAAAMVVKAVRLALEEAVLRVYHTPLPAHRAVAATAPTDPLEVRADRAEAERAVPAARQSASSTREVRRP
jgi:hypothetical protein